MAEAWASRCTPPLPEWAKHVDGLLRREEAKAEGLRMTTPSNAYAPDNAVCNSPEPEPASELTNSEPSPQVPADGISPAQADADSVSPAQDSPLPSAELVSSFAQADGEAEQGEQAGLSAESQCPTLPAEAYHGLLGEMLTAITPETEADPSAVLLGWLTCFGNLVGRSAWVTVGPRLHHPALYVGIVGRTSDGKGDAWAVAKWPFAQVEPEWASKCICNGVGSGEGLVERVADLRLDKDGNAQGGEDKRCLLRLSEMSRVFRLNRRENATLSDNLKEAWDGEPIHVPNRRKAGNALSASDYAISMVGDIQPEPLNRLLETGMEAWDGFANRFLWAKVRSMNDDLDDGGSMEPLRPFLDRLKDALAFAKQAGEVVWDAEAAQLRKANYPMLKRSGDTIPHTDRLKAQVWRLAMLYALVDRSAVIRAEHYRAAFAVVEYCRSSAKMLFGGQQTAEADPLWLRLLNAIGKAPGINRTGLRDVAGHKVKAEEIEEALGKLEAQGMAYKQMIRPEGGGRPAECWFPGKPEGDGDGDGELVCSLHAVAEAVNGEPDGVVSLKAQADAESNEGDAVALGYSSTLPLTSRKADASTEPIVVRPLPFCKGESQSLVNDNPLLPPRSESASLTASASAESMGREGTTDRCIKAVDFLRLGGRAKDATNSAETHDFFPAGSEKSSTFFMQRSVTPWLTPLPIRAAICLRQSRKALPWHRQKAEGKSRKQKPKAR
jgi:hypothetical protein